MGNIWGFLLQTISVSLVAALLLVMKWLLHDKLSPRWQYGVWSILALRILLPVSVARYVLLPIPLWLETLKSMAERTLSSAYSAVYAPISVSWPIPLISSRPVSLTDWLLVVYAAGIVITLLWYLLAYARLRILLRRGAPASAELQGRVEAVRAKYGLKGCRVISVTGLPSAFVCGVFRPVLAIPAGAALDEKIILHELLHLKYHDAAQSVLWCVLRALHWCNPFLHYVFDRVGNDMEALCDQRVLERLEGEERREYGRILLDMANERYPRAPGTTSISNGGKNIARRVDSIVRFKLYPRGMALVSVCIAIVLACPALLGTAAAYGDKYGPNTDGDFEQSMAVARINRCATVAGALDTYAKGLMFDNGVYIATASSLSRHEALATEMRRNVAEENWVAYHLDPGPELTYVNQSEGYYVYNLVKDSVGNYHAFLAFSVSSFLNEDSEGWLQNEAGEPYKGVVAIPVTIRYEDAWVVEEAGERLTYPGMGNSAFDMRYPDSGLPPLAAYAAWGESGRVTMEIVTVYTVNNETQSGWDFFGGMNFDKSVRPAAQFAPAVVSSYVTYEFGGTDQQRQALTSAGYQAVEINSPDDEPQFPNAAMSGDGGGSSSEGWDWSNRTVDEDWDGTVRGGSGGDGQPSEEDDILVALPYGYAVRIFWNGEAVEDFVLKGAGE